VGALAFSAAQIPLAAPGACIVYHVVATNIGTQQVTTVIVFRHHAADTTCLGVPFTTGGAAVTVTPAASRCVRRPPLRKSGDHQRHVVAERAVDLVLPRRINP